MKKIPTLFQAERTPVYTLLDRVTSGCIWVIVGKGIPTEKYDGMACAVIERQLYKRYDMKPGRTKPEGWIACEETPDISTRHWPGWMPVGDGPEDKHFREAFRHGKEDLPADGTFELLGPKVQGNPYGLKEVTYTPHGKHELTDLPHVLTLGSLRLWFLQHPEFEGIVWHHEDGRMVKLKRKNYGLSWPTPEARLRGEGWDVMPPSL